MKQISKLGTLVVLLTFTSFSRAEQAPLWEMGLGLATLNLPHYRGSDQRSTYVLPMPYLVYRGDVIRADREGVRGILFEGRDVQINLSLNGTLPVKSSDNEARTGMESLRPTVQIGPTLDLALWRSENERSQLELRLPLRGSLTVSSSPRYIGLIIEPTLALATRDVPGRGWHARLSAGALFADSAYHGHFYSVHPADATSTRPVYRAPSGYGGAHVTWTVSKRFPQYWLGAFLRYDTLAGSAIESSPLVKQREGISAGLAFAWIVGRSASRVTIHD